MALTVLLGGARSGKSSAAQWLADAVHRRVVYIATATAGDNEMAERINRHRSERPADWTTIEEPTQLDAAIGSVSDGETIIIDCLTLWLTNMMGAGETESIILASAEATAANAARRSGETIAVTNEVGLGLVPPNPMAREFRDIAGRVNRLWVRHSHRAGFVVAGRILRLEELSDWKEARQ
jgi:adenosyl cobinamide kinase/adenosyl cobinamide phosphate guanylyltransferase